MPRLSAWAVGALVVVILATPSIGWAGSERPGSWSPRVPTGVAASPPDPVEYSALGDSITTGYDANASYLDVGEQPYYSYGVGWNTSVLSFTERLNRLYGAGSVTAHLMAVPGDVASDLLWQSWYAVQNHSGFVSILIGGNDVCSSSGGVSSPTPVWNFSASLNRSLETLRTFLPASTVITLANVVDVPRLWTLFGGNAQAEEVWENTCPGLLTASGRSTMQYFVGAYNHIESLIASRFGVSLWDIANFSFTSSMVNDVDYFHPSIFGQQTIAGLWWAQLPYASMVPIFTDGAALPTSLPVGSSLTVSVTARDVAPLYVTATYRSVGMTSWATTVLPLSSGQTWYGTFSGPLPFNATAVAGPLDVYVSATDPAQVAATIPAPPPGAPYVVTITGAGGSGPPGNASTVGSVSLAPSTVRLAPGASLTLTASPLSPAGGAMTGGVAYAWTLSPSALGLLIPEGSGSQALFVAGESSANGTVHVVASAGESSAAASASVSVQVAASLGGAGPPSTVTSAAEPGLAWNPLGSYGLLVVPAVFLGAMLALGVILGRRRTSPR